MITKNNRPPRRAEDSSSESRVDYGGLLKKFQRETTLATELATILCDILVNIVAAFGPCHRNLPEAKVKGWGLISLAKEISRQPNIDSVVKFIMNYWDKGLHYFIKPDILSIKINNSNNKL